MDEPAPTFTHPFQESQFDLFDWDPRFQSCCRYFVEHAQFENAVQAVTRFLNIKLPYQKPVDQPSSLGPLYQHQSGPASSMSQPTAHGASTRGTTVLLVPYIRRLIVTGFDTPSVLHGFFGDDWYEGIGSVHETERRNYLFASKSDNWLNVKKSYDMDDGQTVPFIKPLRDVTLAEIQAAERGWSEWLAMQDWMLGPRNPDQVPGRVNPSGSGVGSTNGSTYRGSAGRMNERHGMQTDPVIKHEN